jgi:hypothetical protein
MSAGLPAAAAGMAKRRGDAGAMLKSRPVLVAATLFSDVAFQLYAVITFFSCAQSGRARSTPMITVTAHFSIVFLPKFIHENPV